MSSLPNQRRPKAWSASNEAWRNLRAFREAYAWLLGDLIRFARAGVLIVVALNLAGVVLQWAFVGGVLIFVGELTGEGGAFQVPLLGGLDLPASDSFKVVAGWSVVVLVIVAVAVATTYGAEVLGFQTALRYVDRSGGKILSGMLAARTMPPGDKSPTRELQLVLARDQVMVLRALIVLQRALRAILMAVVAGVVLALINPLLTAIVALAASMFIAPYYLVNRRLVGAASVLEQRSVAAKVSIARLVEHTTVRDPDSEIERVVPAMYASDPAIAGLWATLRDIMLSGQRIAAVMTGLIGTCLVAVVVAFSLIISRDGASWVAALTYIVGLNLAAGAFSQLASQVTAANRFLPHIQEYASFFARVSRGESRHGAREAHATPEAGLPPLQAPEPTLMHSETTLSLDSASRFFCIWPEPTDRLNVHVLLSKLVAGTSTQARLLRDAAFFHGDASGLPPVPIRALCGEHGMAVLSSVGLADEVLGLPDREATVLTPRVTARMTPRLRYVLGLLHGLDKELLILFWKPFSKLRPEDRDRVLEVIGARPVLFIHAAGPTKQPAHITHTVVVGQHGIEGMGDAGWYRRVAGVVQADADERARGAAGVALDDIADDA